MIFDSSLSLEHNWNNYSSTSNSFDLLSVVEQMYKIGIRFIAVIYGLAG